MAALGDRCDSEGTSKLPARRRPRRATPAAPAPRPGRRGCGQAAGRGPCPWRSTPSPPWPRPRPPASRCPGPRVGAHAPPCGHGQDPAWHQRQGTSPASRPGGRLRALGGTATAPSGLRW